MSSDASTHWYDAEGKPMYTIIGKNGKERNTNLKDARGLNLYPSVTTILGVAAKPALENWKIDQALQAAITLPRMVSESDEQFMKRAKWESKQEAVKAASRGTEIHADIERGFLGEDDNPTYRAVKEAIKGYVKEPIAEDSFSASEGYAGRVDLYCPVVGSVIDFKTKDGLADKEANKLAFDEHGMQLSAYANGLNIASPVRVSVFIDRADPTLVKVYEWSVDTHKRHTEMFLALLNYWQLLKNYSPKMEKAA